MTLITDSAGAATVPLWLDGAALPIDQNHVFPIVNAASGKTVHYAQGATVDQALAAADSAAKAFKTWKKATVSVRRDLLLKTADIFEARMQQFMKYQIDETSTDETWARMNVTLAVNYLKETAARISSVTGSIPQIDKPDTMGFVFREPVGPVLTIPPWNGAVVLATRAVGTALAAGCTVVLKSSELCPQTHAAILDAFTSAGVPPGVLNSIQCARTDAQQVTNALIAHPRIRKIEFIGSAAIGRLIGAEAARHLKPCLMELGGKTPAIVLDDADLDKAAALCARGALINHGQICFSTERIIVHARVAEAFQEKLAAAIRDIPAGCAVTVASAQHAHDVLADAERHGSKFLVGGPSLTGPASLAPTIVLQPAASARIVDEETFGPSASLYVVESDDAAIELANSSSYGLNATIHSRDMERALKMAKELEYGQVHINSISVWTAATGPQGGVKGSGWGRQNAEWGLSEFVQEKFVSFHGQDS